MLLFKQPDNKPFQTIPLFKNKERYSDRDKEGKHLRP